MKKRIFHLVLSVTLFVVLSTVLTVGGEKIEGYKVKPSLSENGTALTEGENYRCVGKSLEVTAMPKRVIGGDTVTVTFKGEAYTDYEIKVYYMSGISTSESLSPTRSDGGGGFGWEFTVPSTVKPGEMRITVLGEGTHLSAEIEIVE